MSDMPEMIEGWPNFCGEEARVEAAMKKAGPFYLNGNHIEDATIQSAW